MDRHGQGVLNRPPFLSACLDGSGKHVFDFKPSLQGFCATVNRYKPYWLGPQAWHGQCLFRRVPQINAPVKCGRRKFLHLQPVFQAQGLSIKRYKLISTRIPCLLSESGPATVLSTIRTIAIRVTIQRMLRTWAWSHIAIKGSKRLFPAVANNNTSSAVVRIIARLRIKAALFHAKPNTIFRAIAQAMGIPQRLDSGLFKTSTTTGISTPQQFSNNKTTSPTETRTPPLRFAIRRIVPAINNRQISKGWGANQINKIMGWHDASFSSKGGCQARSERRSPRFQAREANLTCSV